MTGRGFVVRGRLPTDDGSRRAHSNAWRETFGPTPFVGTTGSFEWASDSPPLYDDGRTTMLLHGFVVEPVRAGNGWSADRERLARLSSRMFDQTKHTARELRGNYALAVFSERGDAVFTGDAIGTRALFCAASVPAVGTWFRAVASTLDLPLQIDTAWLLTALAIGTDAGPVAVKGVERMPPGTTLRLGPRGQLARTTDEWPEPQGRLRSRPPVADVARELAPLARQAVERCIPYDGLVGAELSGGLDSSMISALIAEIAPNRLVTASVVHEDKRANEQDYQRAVIDALSPVRSIIIKDSAADDEDHECVISRIQESWLTPGHPDDAQMRVLRAQVHNTGVKTILTGQGGDNWFRPDRGLGFLPLLRTRPLTTAKRIWGFGPDGQTALLQPWREIARPILKRTPPFRNRPSMVPPWMHREVATDSRLLAGLASADAFRTFVPLHPARRFASYRNRPSSYWQNDLVQRSSAMDGILTAHPLLDVDLITAVAQLDDVYRFDGVRERPLQRALMSPTLPDLIRTRESKAEFSSTPREQLRRLGGAAALRATIPVKRGWIDGDVIAEIAERYLRAEPAPGVAIDSVLRIHHWLSVLEPAGVVTVSS